MSQNTTLHRLLYNYNLGKRALVCKLTDHYSSYLVRLSQGVANDTWLYKCNTKKQWSHFDFQSVVVSEDGKYSRPGVPLIKLADRSFYGVFSASYDYV